VPLSSDVKWADNPGRFFTRRYWVTEKERTDGEHVSASLCPSIFQGVKADPMSEDRQMI
jgi:hypothetical protein